MKKLWIVLFLVVLFVAGKSSYAQDDTRNVWTGGKPKKIVVDGDITVVKNERTINFEISTKGFKIGAKEQRDTLYEATRVKEFNKSKEGSGDKWLNEWNETKRTFKPAFVEGFNSVVSKKGINEVKDDINSMYTFLIRPKQMMEFMGSIYFIVDMDVVLTKDRNTIIATVTFPLLANTKKSKQFKTKFANDYYTAGWYLGKYFKDKVYK